MKTIAHFDLDIFPPSANHLQQSTRSGIRYDTPEYKQFKRDFAALVGDKLAHLKEYDGKLLALMIRFHWSGWFTKSRKLRKGRDVSNRIKALEDAIYKAMGIDDAHTVCVCAFKEPPQEGRDASIVFDVLDVTSGFSVHLI